MTQHILVTGAASDIGRAAALALAGDRRAAEGALSDSLRLELKAFGIDVVGAAIVKAVTARRLKTHYVAPAYYRARIALRVGFPTRFSDWVIERVTGRSAVSGGEREQ